MRYVILKYKTFLNFKDVEKVNLNPIYPYMWTSISSLRHSQKEDKPHASNAQIHKNVLKSIQKNIQSILKCQMSMCWVQSGLKTAGQYIYEPIPLFILMTIEVEMCLQGSVMQRQKLFRAKINHNNSILIEHCIVDNFCFKLFPHFHLTWFLAKYSVANLIIFL